MKDEVIRNKNYVDVYIQKMRHSLSEITAIGKEGLLTGKLDSRQFSFYEDTKQFQHGMFDRTRSGRTNTRKLHSHPLE